MPDPTKSAQSHHADSGPLVPARVNGAVNPNYVRSQIAEAGVGFARIGERLDGILRCFNLPPHHPNYLPPSGLATVLLGVEDQARAHIAHVQAARIGTAVQSSEEVKS